MAEKGAQRLITPAGSLSSGWTRHTDDAVIHTSTFKRMLLKYTKNLVFLGKNYKSCIYRPFYVTNLVVKANDK